MNLITYVRYLIVLVGLVSMCTSFRIPARSAVVTYSSNLNSIPFIARSLRMASSGPGNSLDDQTKSKIENVINNNKVVLFMKVCPRPASLVLQLI